MEIFQYEFAIRALIASGLVGILCGMLGCFIILRHMALIGDALSHAILPGVVIGFLIAGYSLTGFFAGAVIAGLVAAILITWVQQNLKTKEDAAIGIVFTAMFAIGIIAISWLSRTGGVHLDMQDFLFGNVLAISNMDLVLTGLITLFVGGSIIAFFRYFFVTTFQPVISTTMGISVNLMHYFLMLLLSFSVVASIQTVGVILVVAMLIVPASTAYLISDRLHIMLIWSAIFGVLAAVSGLMIAILFETTPGPAMTVAAAFIYFTLALFAPRTGFIIKIIKKRRRRTEIGMEDVLKACARLQENTTVSVWKIQELLGIDSSRVQSYLKKMRKRALITYRNAYQEIILTEKGRKRADELIRAHRLWETYLANKLDLPETEIHEQAEEYEHKLPVTLLEDLDKHLGHPKTDPHGSPIPQSEKRLMLADLSAGQSAVINTEQPNNEVAGRLWKKGVLPGSHVNITGVSGDNITFSINGHEISVDKKTASQVVVESVSGSGN